jgi:hypothetical protein
VRKLICITAMSRHKRVNCGTVPKTYVIRHMGALVAPSAVHLWLLWFAECFCEQSTCAACGLADVLEIIVCLHRCADVPHSHRAKRQYCHVLAIIPGPKEPANLAPYLKPLLLDLHEAGPDGEHIGGLRGRIDGAMT